MALKLLPEALASDPDRISPFERNNDVGPDGRFVLVKRPIDPSKPGGILVLDTISAADGGGEPREG